MTRPPFRSRFLTVCAVLLSGVAGCVTASKPAGLVDNAPVEASTAQVAPTIQVHLTIDDLPWMIESGHSIEQDVGDISEKNSDLVKVFSDHQVHTSVFFNCGRLRPEDNSVQTWAEAGHTVGNHTWSHARLASLEAEEWVADAKRCHEHLTAALGKAPKWLRYPYLGYGKDQPQRDAVTQQLSEFGVHTAPVTIATTEWLHAYVYRRAIRTNDDELRKEVVADWHQHMDDALQAGIEAAGTFPGRPVPQTVLVHMNELVIDEIGNLITRWKGKNIQFVDLDTAMTDPVFQMENRYTGPGGLSWLWRIRDPKEYGRYWFGYEQARVQKRFGDINHDDKGAPKED